MSNDGEGWKILTVCVGIRRLLFRFCVSDWWSNNGNTDARCVGKRILTEAACIMVR